MKKLLPIALLVVFGLPGYVAGQNPIPVPFVYGHPEGDPTCDLQGYMYLPDVSAWGPGPYPAIFMTRAGGFTDGGPNNSNNMCYDFAAAGYLTMFGDVRLAKTSSGAGGLPGQLLAATD